MVTTTAPQTATKKVHQHLVQLRRQKLADNHPFMCFEEHLSPDQAIFEYADGRFEVVQIISVDSPALFARKATAAEIAHIQQTNPAYGQ